jgi:glycosyltransferase involved in cell wall biosynthesis
VTMETAHPYLPRMYVTVVIPAYNAEAHLRRAIDSVLAQTHGDLELLVVDDGSTDRSRELAESVDDRRISVVSGPNRGPSVARNIGLRNGAGSFVAFLDADDYWLPAKLEKQLSVMRADPACIGVGALMRHESLDGKALGIAGQVIGADDVKDISTARLMPFTLSSALFRKSAIDALEGFDESLEVASDLDLITRLAAIGDIACVPEVLGAYRVHDASISARRFELQRLTTRFIRARLAAADRGELLTWEEFRGSYRRTLRQGYGDKVQGWYRAAGQSVAARDWLNAIRFGGLALVAGPRYTLGRLYRQRGRGLAG